MAIANIETIRDFIEKEWLHNERYDIIGVCTGNHVKHNVVQKTPAVNVFVKKKKALKHLTKQECMPSHVAGYRIDIIEMPVMPMWGFHKRVLPMYIGSEVGRNKTGQKGTCGLIYRIHEKDYALTNWHVMASRKDYLDPQKLLGVEMTYPGSATKRIWNLDHTAIRNMYSMGRVTHVLSPFEDGFDAVAVELFHSLSPIYPERGWNAPGERWDGIIDQMQRAGHAKLRDVICSFPHHHLDYDSMIHPGRTRASHPMPPLLFPSGIASISKGGTVWKSGARTGVTRMKVFTDNLTVRMNYFGENVVMKNMMAMTSIDGRSIIGARDSGSTLIDAKTRAVVGQLFAGSGKWAVGQPIIPVLSKLHGIEL